MDWNDVFELHMDLGITPFFAFLFIYTIADLGVIDNFKYNARFPTNTKRKINSDPNVKPGVGKM